MNSENLLNKSIEKIGEFNRFGSKPGLERVSDLLNRVGNPQKELKVIHVGGTNGKGSVCRYVYSVLQRAGYKAGLFISPYIEEFTERIEYDGKQISPEDLYRITMEVTDKAAEMVADGLDSPTEFEVLTAIAMVYFRDKNADAIILEVGLGGSGDSTNVIDKPMATCITSVSFDHMDYLGDTIEMIAAEKAGIMKAGCPIVYAAEDEAVKNVIEAKARELNAPLFNVVDYNPEILEGGMGFAEFSVTIDGKDYKNVKTGMPGLHQVSNAECAIKLVSILNEECGFEISEKDLLSGIREAKMPGRIEIISENPLVVLDGSHNRDSIRVLREWYKSNFAPEDRMLVVTGVLKDKEYELMAEMLSDIGTDFIVTEPDNPRKLDGDLYKSVIEKYLGNKGRVSVMKNADEAAVYAMNECSVNNDEKCVYKGLIFTGSLYMIGVVRKVIKGILMEA